MDDLTQLCVAIADHIAVLTMAASSDILITSEKGSLGLPEVDVGLLGGCRHAMRLFSHSRLGKHTLNVIEDMTLHDG